MPKEKTQKLLCVENLRHAEYYGMQEAFDNLYAKSKAGDNFTDLMDLILSRENILLAYRNIKANTGSKTAGTDKLTIDDIGRLSPDEVVNKVRLITQGNTKGYTPKPVRRKDIPKPNGSTRPLGIPCIWDRLIQQCIKQIMEPICEAKFSNNSYGFRPNRSVEHAIAATYKLLQRSNLHYVVEFDIKGFFDNVNHSKLIKQLWTMGIRDKKLLWIIKRILKAPIRMPDGSTQYPDKGTPQGGIISPLLANVVLNELDQWIDSQWQNNPVTRKYKGHVINGETYYDPAYPAMRKTNLKEMFIVRYADDFRIFCRTKTDAEKTMIATTQWLEKRLKLEVSKEKTRVVNAKRRCTEFLGFKIKVYPKGNNAKYAVTSHISDKKLKQERQKLISQAKRIAAPTQGRKELDEIRLYNSQVLGIQNYYRIATEVQIDCDEINRAVMTVLTNRLSTQRGDRLKRTGRKLTEKERKAFGQSKRLRYVAGPDEPIYPIGYVQHKNPMNKKRSVNCYTPEGRVGLHDNLSIKTALMYKLMRQPLYDRSAEYADNRISLYSAQLGKCAITGREFVTLDDIHCHHKIPREQGGTDAYENLCLVLEPVHKLIHATKSETIKAYLELLNLTAKEIKAINALRTMAGLPEIK